MAFALVVGPSGAGKDTLIRLAREELAGDPRFAFPRRLVTRPPSADEDNTPIDAAAFDRARPRAASACAGGRTGWATPCRRRRAGWPSRGAWW